ncbi:MAG: translocation/assembly module TamB [Bacteroidales bacterium]|nr:translocation/assembly module TamB [Candidatus Sodaliphilus aphodohippi]
MKAAARRCYKGVRFVIVTALVAVVAAFVLTYVALSIPAVQNKIKEKAEVELSKYLHTNVSIGDVSIMPFNEVVLNDVEIPDQQGGHLISVKTLGAGVSLYNLIKNKRLVFTYGEIIGLKGTIWRPDKQSPTNMQFLIDVFKPKPNQPPKPFDITAFNVVIRDSEISYDVRSEKPKGDRFDVNHLHVNGLRADIALPKLNNDDFDIEIKRLAMHESSGLCLKNFATHAVITQTQTSLTDIKLELPNSVLAVNDIYLDYTSLKELPKEIKSKPLSLALSSSSINPIDFKAFEPKLGNLNRQFEIAGSVNGTMQSATIPSLSVRSYDDLFKLNLNHATYSKSKNDIFFDVQKLILHAKAADVIKTASIFTSLPAKASSILAKCNNIDIDAKAQGTKNDIKLNGKFTTGLGNVNIDGEYAKASSTIKLKGKMNAERLQLGTILDKTDLLGMASFNADFDATLNNNKLEDCQLNAVIPHIDFKGIAYNNIKADINKKGDTLNGKLVMDDASQSLNLDGNARLAGANSSLDLNLIAQNINLSRLGIIKNVPDAKVSIALSTTLSGNNLSNITGTIDASDIKYSDSKYGDVKLSHISIDASNSSTPQSIDISSDFVNGSITGRYDFETLIPSVRNMLAKAFPKFFKYDPVKRKGVNNDIHFNFTIDPDEDMQAHLHLPVKFIYKTTVNGLINDNDNTFNINVNAPYILSGKKLIEGTCLTAKNNPDNGSVALNAKTLLPLKQGKMSVNIDAAGINDHLDANVGWKVLREQDFHGDLNISAMLDRCEDKSIKALINVNPTQMVFNDTAWQVEPATVEVANGRVTVNNIQGHNAKQYIKINGFASKNPNDNLCLELNNVSLDYVFETLNINHVSFGGRATGKFYASNLFSKTPTMYTPQLHVDKLSYNNALMGDADIESHWLNDEKAVSLRANLSQSNGKTSVIDGAIFAGDDSLHLTFNCDHANVGFLKPYMAAFTSDVQGEVSGKAVLLGNFHTINLYGDVKADSLRFKLDYTNVYYTCRGDSVHMKPNLITFNDVKIHDREGNTASMTGWLRHDSFHSPSFNFAVTGAKNLLCYDTNPSINPIWYGQIYGNGAAFVTGEPGIVDIKVNMTSAPKSKFTFVLSDAEEAYDYKFITFRDRNRTDAIVPPVETDTVPEIVRQLTAKAAQEVEGPPTQYFIDLQGDITPDAQVVVVMDPVGGDQIKATGHGNLRLTYNNNDEMTMFGKYTLEKGNYNFTLQDIIVKDFTIRDGSSISFQGDPYAAMLDIEAVYSLNANLKDLDESFVTDNEIKRSNVPVNALLRAKGIISQPAISFDLEFPTLTTDAYRKVKSIISTDEMMSQQILYLLVLNRFYTPDYMNATNTNNELTSMASSTISSQLSSILGKMSDKWSIAPNFRSNKGDFSDVEVDVALTSQLLNNRLLFNGNFGYRDNAYNNSNSNFIGDFDIEYLLNAKGSLRLKAYNHFNDQNYYVRNALTTQGVGIVWKHEFDKPGNIIKYGKLKLKPFKTDSIKKDSTIISR